MPRPWLSESVSGPLSALRRADQAVLTACEAGFAASLIYYLTTFYPRGELGKRIAAFYSCQCLSGAFSGLLSYGVFQADSHLHGWQILFLIEVSVATYRGPLC